MRVTVRLFAAFRERAGANQIVVDVAEPATVADVVDAVVRAVPSLATIITAARPVVNQEFVASTLGVTAGDEVALLPPVSGG